MLMSFIKKFLALLNTAEGSIHIIVATVGMWGIFSTGIYDWRIVSPPAINFVLGLFSLLTGFVLVSKRMGVLKKVFSVLNTLEGAIHLGICVVGFWGIFTNMIFDWRLWAAPSEHLFFGIFSILTGYILKEEDK